MIIRLTPERMAACHRAVRTFPALDQMWEPVRSSPARFDVPLPAVGWLWIYENLLDTVYNIRGYKRGEVKRSELGALKAVRSALNFRERHPALRGTGMLGWHREVLPAWRAEPGMDVLWEPYPNGNRFGVLVPVYHTVGGRRVTVWSEGVSPRPDHLLTEDFHLSLGIQVQSGRIEQD